MSYYFCIDLQLETKEKKESFIVAYASHPYRTFERFLTYIHVWPSRTGGPGLCKKSLSRKSASRWSPTTPTPYHQTPHHPTTTPPPTTTTTHPPHHHHHHPCSVSCELWTRTRFFHDPAHRPQSRQVTGARCTEVAAHQSWAEFSSSCILKQVAHPPLLCTAEQRWVRSIQRSIKKWSYVNFQFQFHEQIAHELIYMTHEPWYIYIFIIVANMRFNHTKSAIHSPGHSHSLFTSARDCESAHWTLVLHIPVNVFTKCQYKTNAGSSLAVQRVRCKQFSEATMEPAVEKPGDTCGLHVESLTRNESTCACPATSYWAITSMRERTSKGCASVPKHFYMF